MEQSENLEAPKKRVFMSDILKGIVNETLVIGDTQYIFPSPCAVRDEEVTIWAGLQSKEEKESCHALYSELYEQLVSAREALKVGDFREANRFFDQATSLSEHIQKGYTRNLEADTKGDTHVDITVDGIGPKPPHIVDKKV
jgi:hypothetical protein